MDVTEWLEEIQDAKNREKDFRKDGKLYEEIYEGEHPDKYPFNILYSNTETLIPALYSQTPRPIVKRRYRKQDSPLIQSVELAGTRMLEYLLDTNMEEYEKFDDSMTDAVKDSAVPGRGVTQIKFDADIDDEDNVNYASVCTESRKWNKIYFGHAEKWSKVPWAAIEEYLTKDEAKELFGEELIKDIEFSHSDDQETDRSDKKTGEKTAVFYQIWDKTNKQVIWISEQSEEVLDEEDDPLEISGFFPFPKPLTLVKKSNNLVPTALYTLYKNQATELNRITTRLNRVIEAIKIRGGYDGALGDEFERIFDGDDNELIPVQSGVAMAEGGFDRAIWLMPVEKLIVVAQQLMEAREQCKRVIYEITGLSDIIRGMSRASETLGAQKIKESWGTMRLKNMQKDVQKYVRDTLRIMLDVASKKIPQRFWPDFTGLDFPSEEEKQMNALQIRQMEAQIKQALSQQQPVNPALKDGIEKLKTRTALPTWDEVLEALKNDLVRSYTVDIETNSTLDIEATEDKKQVAEFMNALAQFMNGIQPMINSGIMPFGAAKSMILEVVRRYRFGIDVENEIKQMQPPKGGDPEKAQEQLKKQGKELQQAQQKLAQSQKTFDSERERVGKELDQKVLDLQKREMELEIEKEKMKMQNQLDKAMQKNAEMLAMEKVKLQDEKQRIELGQIAEKQKRDIQSMMDKASANIEKMMKTIEPKEREEKEEKGITIVNQMPDGSKSISIRRNETGMIEGADVE